MYAGSLGCPSCTTLLHLTCELQWQMLTHTCLPCCSSLRPSTLMQAATLEGGSRVRTPRMYSKNPLLQVRIQIRGWALETVCSATLITVSLHSRWGAHMLYGTVQACARVCVCVATRSKQWNLACNMLFSFRWAPKWQCLAQRHRGWVKCSLLVGMFLNMILDN